MANHTLLVADDSHTVRRIVEMACVGHDVAVVAVADGEGAIAEISHHPPDIVLADIEMPGRSGYDVAAFVKGRADLAHIPVLLMAGMHEAADAARAAAVGCAEVLIKPLRPQVVVDRMKHWLDATHDAPVVASSMDAAPGEATVPDLPFNRPVSPSPSDEGDVEVVAATAEASALDAFEPDAGVRPSVEEVPAAQSSPAEDYFSRLDAAFKTLAHPAAGGRALVDEPEHGAWGATGESVPTLQELLDRLPHETRTRLAEAPHVPVVPDDGIRNAQVPDVRAVDLVDAIAARVLEQLVDREDVLDAIARRLARRQSSGDHR